MQEESLQLLQQQYAIRTAIRALDSEPTRRDRPAFSNESRTVRWQVNRDCKVKHLHREKNIPVQEARWGCIGRQTEGMR